MIVIADEHYGQHYGNDESPCSGVPHPVVAAGHIAGVECLSGMADLETLRRKLGFLETELGTAYDSEKKFALQIQIGKLRAQLAESRDSTQPAPVLRYRVEHCQPLGLGGIQKALIVGREMDLYTLAMDHERGSELQGVGAA